MSPVSHRFLSYAASVLISVFLVAAAAFGVTTISENISTEGTLSVTGASTFTGPVYASSTLTVTGRSSFFGNVGIGTSTPGTTFAVSGNISVTGSTTVSGLSATSSVITPLISVTGSATSSFTGGISTAGLFSSNGVTITGGSIINTSAASSSLANGINLTAGCFSISGACVGGGGGGGGWTNAGGAIYPTTATERVGVGGSTTPWGLFSVESVKGTVSATVPILAVGDTGTTSPFLLISGNNGNIGIGSTTPWAQLSINNLAGATNPLFAVATSTQFQNGTTTTVFVIDSVGRVGIGGTTSPSEVLTVTGNISNLAASSSKPILKSSITTIGASPRGVYVAGRYAYVIGGDGITNRLEIYDVSTTTPSLVSATTNIGGGGGAAGIFSPFVAGRYLYALTTGGRLLIYDVHNPATTTLVGFTDGIESSARNLYVSGKYAYVPAVGTGPFSVIDVSLPERPRIVGKSASISGEQIVISGNYAYTLGSGILQAVDISNPFSPQPVSSFTIPVTEISLTFGLAVSGNYAYVAYSDTEDGGETSFGFIAIIDISNRYSFRLVSRIGIIGTPEDSTPNIFISGRYLYVVGRSGTMAVYDVLDPLNPKGVGSVSLGAATAGSAIFVAGRYAYVVNTSGRTLNIVDIGGLETASAIIHSLETDNLQVRGNIISEGHLRLRGGVNIGTPGLLSHGSIGVVGSSTAPDLTSASFGDRVAVGTSTPVARLTVWGSGTQNSSLLRLINRASTTVLNVLENGNVGIGTSTPFAQLSIAATSTGNMPLFAVSTSSATATSTIFLISGISGNVGLGTSTPEGVLSIDNTTKGVPALLINAAGPAEGNVAIAVSSDDSCREGNSAACALNDLAELFPTSVPLEAGDVAMFDSSDYPRLKKAVASSVSANPGVLAGVISTSPAIVFEGSGLKAMGGAYEISKDKAPLALAGRVPVKVNLEGGSIKTGDPISISSIPGVGKRAVGSGRIVGYALEPFTGETLENGGKALVFAQNDYWLGSGAEAFAAPAAAIETRDDFRSWFANLGIIVKDELIKLKELIADIVRAKKVIVEELEMKDRTTGEIYCVTIQGGELQKVKGECATSQ